MYNLSRRLALAAMAVAPFYVYAADALTWQQQEEFLRKAKVIKIAESKKGVTGKPCDLIRRQVDPRRQRPDHR